MNNNQNNDNNNNYVIPQSIDTTNDIPHNDTMLNRERDNIVSATIQANSAIDKRQATEVNNEIKIEKRHGYMFVVVIVTVIVVSIAVGFVIYKLTSSVVKYSDDKHSTTTTTITTSPLDRFNSYLRDYSKVRKFVGDNYILLLTKDGIDLKNNKEYYLLLHTSDEGLIENKYGTYTIENNKVKLDNSSYEYNQEGIKYNDELLKIYDSEMKYYQYKDNEISYLLIINATMKNEFSMFISSNKDNVDVKLQTFKETDSSITLGDNTVFAKVENNITYNNYTLTLVG